MGLLNVAVMVVLVIFFYKYKKKYDEYKHLLKDTNKHSKDYNSIKKKMILSLIFLWLAFAVLVAALANSLVVLIF